MWLLWIFVLFLADCISIEILEITPPVSPLSGGDEIFIRGVGFNDTVKAEFGINPGVLVSPKSFTNYNGRLTASFISPPGSDPWVSNRGQWVRLVDGGQSSQAVSFHWEDPITITSVSMSSVAGGRTRFQVSGTGFTPQTRCSTPNHKPIKARVASGSSLSCILPSASNVTGLSVLSEGGSVTTYSFVPTISPQPEYGNATLIFAWSGAVDRKHPDYVAIIDAVPESPTYQQIIARAELPAELAVNNEPHHMQLVNNQTVLVAGGLLSLLHRPQELFFWNISDPLKPVFLKADNPYTSVVDDVFLLPEGGFLVSIMGAHDGSTPGAIGEWDVNLNLVGEWPEGPRPPTFNPHGISIRPELDLLITSDFLDPASTLKAVGGPVLLRDTVQIWHPWSARKISSTIEIPKGNGLMDVKFIKGNPEAIAYVTNYHEGDGMIVWGIKALESTIFQALNLSNFYTFTADDFSIHQQNSRGTRYILSHPASGWLVMLDTTDAQHPTVLDAINFGLNSGLHSLDLSSDERYIMVSGYFLNEDDFGVIHYDGDRTVHVVEMTDNQLIRTDFNVDMNVAAEYPMRPHMCRFYNKPIHRTA